MSFFFKYLYTENWSSRMPLLNLEIWDWILPLSHIVYLFCDCSRTGGYALPRSVRGDDRMRSLVLSRGTDTWDTCTISMPPAGKNVMVISGHRPLFAWSKMRQHLPVWHVHARHSCITSAECCRCADLSIYWVSACGGVSFIFLLDEI